MGDSKTITVSTEFGEVVVHKMPLSDYAELLKKLEAIPKTLVEFFKDYDQEKLSKMNNMDYVMLLPGLLATSWPDLIDVVSITTDKDAKFISKLDLPDAVDVAVAVLELNDLPRIIAAVKKVQALGQKIAPAIQPAEPKTT